MKIEHIQYLEHNLEKMALDNELLETYSAKSWKIFVIRHMNNTRKLLREGLGSGLQFPLDIEIEEYFVKIFRKLVKTEMISKNDVPKKAILKYLDAVLCENNRQYSQLIWNIFELCFSNKVEIPEDILRRVLYYVNMRIKVLKMLLQKTDHEKIKSLVQYYAPDIERELNLRVMKSLNEFATPLSPPPFPTDLIPARMSN